MEVSKNFGRSIGLNSVFGPNRPMSLSPYHDHSRLNLGLDHPFITDDDRSFTTDFTGEFPVDPDRFLKGQLPFKFRPPTQQSINLFSKVLLSLPQNRPL